MNEFGIELYKSNILSYYYYFHHHELVMPASDEGGESSVRNDKDFTI